MAKSMLCWGSVKPRSKGPDHASSQFRLTEKVIHGAKAPGRQHEAIGGQRKVLRRNALAEAICYYSNA
jgi:hypothetical protein